MTEDRGRTTDDGGQMAEMGQETRDLTGDGEAEN